MAATAVRPLVLKGDLLGASLLQEKIEVFVENKNAKRSMGKSNWPIVVAREMSIELADRPLLSLLILTFILVFKVHKYQLVR